MTRAAYEINPLAQSFLIYFAALDVSDASCEYLVMSLSPAQLRQGRALLGMSAQSLAEHAGVSLRTVQRFECGHTEPIPITVKALREALERGGVQFSMGSAKLREEAGQKCIEFS